MCACVGVCVAMCMLASLLCVCACICMCECVFLCLSSCMQSHAHMHAHVHPHPTHTQLRACTHTLHTEPVPPVTISTFHLALGNACNHHTDAPTAHSIATCPVAGAMVGCIMHSHENGKESGLCMPNGRAPAQYRAPSATHPHRVQHTPLHTTQCASTRPINRGAQEGPGHQGGGLVTVATAPC